MKLILLCTLILALNCTSFINQNLQPSNLGQFGSNFGLINGLDIFGKSNSKNVLECILKKTQNLFSMSKAQLQSLLSQIENNKVALGNSYQYLSTLLKNAISQKNKKQNYKKFFGKTSAWQKYLDAGGIFVDVDISHLKLKNPPFVNTYLTSQGGSIWQLTGPSAIYDLTNKGFRVFLSKPEDLKYASVQNAKTFGWILNYQVISLD